MSRVNRWVSVLCGAAAALALSTWGTQVALSALLGHAAGPSADGRWCAVVAVCPTRRSVGDHRPTPAPGPGTADVRRPVTPTTGGATGQPSPADPGGAGRPAHW